MVATLFKVCAGQVDLMLRQAVRWLGAGTGNTCGAGTKTVVSTWPQHHRVGGDCSSAGTYTSAGRFVPGRSGQCLRLTLNGMSRSYRRLQVVAAGVLEDGWAAGAVDDGVGDTVGLGAIVSS